MPDIPTGALVGAAKAVSRFRPWAVTKRHDRLVRQEYQDLLTFARDELEVEAQALQTVRNDLAARGMLNSGALGAGLLAGRNEFAKRWRDFKRASDRRIAEWQEAEGIGVRIWRVIFGSRWPVNSDADELRTITHLWEDEALRREAVEHEVAPQAHAERETAVWFMPEEKIWDVDQAAGYRGQIGNHGQTKALGVTAQMVAETGEPCANSELVGDLEVSQSTQREFQVMCPHPRLYCRLSWRDETGEEFSYKTSQVFPANPVG
jgi:hypothetical protein